MLGDERGCAERASTNTTRQATARSRPKGNIPFVLHVHLHSTAAWHGVFGGNRGRWLREVDGIDKRRDKIFCGLDILYMNTI